MHNWKPWRKLNRQKLKKSRTRRFVFIFGNKAVEK